MWYRYYATLYGVTSAFDPVSASVIASGQYLVHTYDPVARNVSNVRIRYCNQNGGPGGIWNDAANGAILPAERLFVLAGSDEQFVYNISDPFSPCLTQNVNYTILGGSPVIPTARSPGIVYHPGERTLVGYAGGADVFVLNTTTLRWKRRAASANNTVIPLGPAGGFWSRWQYIPSYDVFVILPEYNQDAYFYKLGPDVGSYHSWASCGCVC